jgi:hypothetical protein
MLRQGQKNSDLRLQCLAVGISLSRIRVGCQAIANQQGYALCLFSIEK